jgi:hypothetical protein
VTMQYRFPTAAAGSMSVSGDYPGELSLVIVGAPAAADSISFSGTQITFAGGFRVNHSLLDYIVFDGLGGWDVVSLAGASAVMFPAPQELESLTIASGLATLAAGGDNTLATRSLTVAGRLDLNDNDVIIDYATGGVSPVGVWTGDAYDGVSGLVKSANVFSSLASGTLKTLGVAEARDALNITGTQTTTWSGQSVDSTSVLVKFTWGGDATLDGKINIDDYGQIDFNVAAPTPVLSWFWGDFNLDGKINIDDYGIIDFNVAAQDEIL